VVLKHHSCGTTCQTLPGTCNEEDKIMNLVNERDEGHPTIARQMPPRSYEDVMPPRLSSHEAETLKHLCLWGNSASFASRVQYIRGRSQKSRP
jgi:hypothetical protein